MSKGYMYILECADGSYYTGSTKDLERRFAQHQVGEGANHTKKHMPVKLVYFEEFQRIDEAFYREKQVQGWSRKKKEALINGDFDKLSHLARNYTEYPTSAGLETVTSAGSVTDKKAGSVIRDNTGSVTEKKTSSVIRDNAGSVTEKKAGSVTRDNTGSVIRDNTGSVTKDNTSSVTNAK